MAVVSVEIERPAIELYHGGHLVGLDRRRLRQDRYQRVRRVKLGARRNIAAGSELRIRDPVRFYLVTQIGGWHPRGVSASWNVRGTPPMQVVEGVTFDVESTPPRHPTVLPLS